MENTQSTIDSLRELNSNLVHQITELRKKFAEVEAENAELAEAENAKRDGRVEELEQKNIKLETRLAILEQNSLVVDGQPQSDKEVIPEMQLSIDNTVSAVNVSDPIVDQLDNASEVSSKSKIQFSCASKQKTLEDKETDAFLNEVHKKRSESPSQEAHSISQNTASTTSHARKNEWEK
ncbi:hypothetical protein Glove_54g13 [Diversispora epigaea]|uniref:Uncharacterized protein n=1 Tax=Diversispora epigaea TaxID=1348612 RepID=A0A397JNN3_9GLOM|nr:hypothetical protein Glove_54g13 [Diversispora epigaea]